MRLDYSVPDFQFLIGAFDCTDYLDSISLSQPIHEVTQVLTWSGRFTVSFNRKAIARGLLEADFDQNLTPVRWRPNQVQIKLKIKGYTLPVMRIDRYAYNAQTGQGEGVLHQLIDAVATDRPAVDPPLQIGGARSAGAPLAPVSVDAAVIGLLNAAFYGCSINPLKHGRLMPGLIYGEISTRNPVSDAQRLAGIYWNWLTVDNAEAVRTVNGDSSAVPPLFSRTLKQLEWVPDIDHLNFAAEQVIVTGSCQRPAPIPCAQNPVAPDTSLDRKGRPKYQRVVEQQPFSKIFAKGAQGNLSAGIAEVKWIFYQYPDDLNWDSQLLQFMPNNLTYERDAASNSDRYGPIDQPCQTVTVYEWPLGRVFSDQGTANNLVVAALEMQSEKRKGRWVPYGLLDTKNQKGNLILGLERYEDLTTGVTYPGQADHAGVINPVTGKAQCLELAPKKEERQPLAENPLETVPIAGRASVAPAGWTPICRRDLTLEVGFLPDIGTANYLAQQIARREAWRRDSVKVVMPIPDEWLAAGCPPLRRAYLHDGHWQIDGIILSLQGDEAKFAFTAARIDREGQPTISIRNEIIIRVRSRVQIDSATRPLSETTPITIRVIAVPGSGGGGVP
jgi:hypothetical protein